MPDVEGSCLHLAGIAIAFFWLWLHVHYDSHYVMLHCETCDNMHSTGKLGFDPNIWNNKLKLSGYVEEAYLTTVPKVPKNPVAGFSKMAEKRNPSLM